MFGALNRMVYDRHRFRPQFDRLLEIGSGRGDFLATLNAGDRAIGLERSQAARIAGKQIGVEVVVGDVERCDLFTPGSFDCMYSNHAFEHLNEPELSSALDAYLVEAGRESVHGTA